MCNVWALIDKICKRPSCKIMSNRHILFQSQQNRMWILRYLMYLTTPSLNTSIQRQLTLLRLDLTVRQCSWCRDSLWQLFSFLSIQYLSQNKNTQMWHRSKQQLYKINTTTCLPSSQSRSTYWWREVTTRFAPWVPEGILSQYRWWTWWDFDVIKRDAAYYQSSVGVRWYRLSFKFLFLWDTDKK